MHIRVQSDLLPASNRNLLHKIMADPDGRPSHRLRLLQRLPDQGNSESELQPGSKRERSSINIHNRSSANSGLHVQILLF